MFAFLKELFGLKAKKPTPRKPNVIFPRIGNEIGFHTFAIPSTWKKKKEKPKPKGMFSLLK